MSGLGLDDPEGIAVDGEPARARPSGPPAAEVGGTAPLGPAGRDAVLLALEDRLRPLAGAEAVQQAAAEALGQWLGADRVNYVEIDEAAGTCRIAAEWSVGRLPRSKGQVLGLPLVGPLVAALRTGGTAVSADIGQDPRFASLHGSAAQVATGVAAMLEVPLVKDGALVAALSVNHAAPRDWSAEEVALAEAVAERTWAAAERARAEAALRESEARERARAEEIAAIYAAAPVGLAVLDRDLRYLRINDLLAEINGLPAADHVGRSVREVVPDLADQAEAVLRRVLAGEEVRGIEISGSTPARPGVQRTWRENWLPLRDRAGRITGITISAEEITGEKDAERLRAYLLRLEESLRASASSREALDAACEALGRELGAPVVLVNRLDADGEHVVVESGWSREGASVPFGRHRLADYGRGRLGPLFSGRTVSVEDVASDPRIEDPAPFAALGLHAGIDVPLTRDGRMRGMMFVGNGRPRRWAPQEIALVEETAARAWQAAERARAEAELRASEARFRQLAETIREVFYVVELDEGRMGYVSPAYEEVWGRPAEALYADAEAFMADIHPEDLPRVRVLRSLLLGGEPVDGEYRLRRPDGSLRYIRDRAVVATDPATGARRAVGLAADVTERRRAEERLQLATAAADLGIFDVNLLTLEMEWDGRQRALWGVATDATITDDLFVAGVHPEDRDIMRAAVTSAMDPGGDGLYRAEYRIVPLDRQEVRWIAATGRVHFEGGRAVRLIGTVQDITDRKEAEAAIAGSEARFRTLADTLPALIFVAEAHGNVFVNAQYLSYTGFGAEGLLGEAWTQAIHPEDRAAAREGAFRSWREATTYTAETRFRRADGAWRWHLVRGQPILDAEGRVTQWVGAATDIEEMVEARETLARSRAVIEEANAALEARVAERTASLAEANRRLGAEIERRETAQAALVQAQKLEAVGQLTSGIAHDFNNVIAAIAGGFSVIERRTGDPRLVEVARHGIKAAERGGLLVKQLLAFARQQVLAPRVVDLPALLREAEPLIARSVGPGVELSIDCPPDAGSILIDPVQLETALINLAVNARDAMGGSGRLGLAVRPSPPEEPGHPAELGGRAALAISVTDTGCGIPAGLLARVVEPFFTTKEPGRGTGLGLAMVHGFVHQSGGALRIASREGEGTAVVLFLPMAGLGPPEPVRDPAARDIPASPGGAVLLVDDDAEVRGVTAAQLADLGYRVLAAGGADEALAVLAAEPGIGLVLTDVAMPGRDGPALAAEILRLRPGLPVLFMTGHAERDRLAGEAVLDKPFTFHALAWAVATRIARAATPPPRP